MKNIIRCLMFVAFCQICQAEMLDTTTLQAVPKHTVKKPIPPPEPPPAPIRIEPAPVRTVLDEVVVKPDNVWQKDVWQADVRQNDVSLNDVPPNDPLPNAVQPNAVAPSLHSLVGSWFSGFSPELSGGVATFRAGGQADTGASVALRIRPQDPTRWGMEMGSILPHKVPGDLVQASLIQPSVTYDAHLASFFEIHAAAIHNLPHGDQDWAIPEVGLGLSFLHAVNEIQSATLYTGTYDLNGQTVNYAYTLHQKNENKRWSVSPLLRLGVVLFPRSLVSFRMGVSYVGYANTAKAFGQTFDLGLSGVMVENALQIRL